MASTMMDLLMGQLLGGSAIDQVSRQLSTDKSTTNKAIAAALPTLVAALARNASSPAGATALHGALARDHNGSLLDNLDSYVGAGDTSAGNAILGHVLGAQRGAVETGLGQQTGLDPKLIQQLLPVLAPIVLAYLGRAQLQKQLDPGGLAGLLTAEQSQVAKVAPQLEGLAGLLDANRDGVVTEDAKRIGFGLLGRLLRGGGK